MEETLAEEHAVQGDWSTERHLHLHRRVVDDGKDMLITESAPWQSGEELCALVAASQQRTEGGTLGGEGWTLASVASDDLGFVFFDGGSSSSGPLSLFVRTGAAQVLEHTLAWDGDHRLRVRVALHGFAPGPAGELHAAALWIDVTAERWMGVPGVWVEQGPPPDDGWLPRGTAPRTPAAAEFEGRWQRAGVLGSLVHGIDVGTGDPCLLTVHENVEQEVVMSREGLPAVPWPPKVGMRAEAPAGAGSADPETAGDLPPSLPRLPASTTGPPVTAFAACLSPGVLVQLEGTRAGGIALRTLWLVGEGVLVGMEREHDGQGRLVGALSSTSLALEPGVVPNMTHVG